MVFSERKRGRKKGRKEKGASMRKAGVREGEREKRGTIWLSRGIIGFAQ